MEPCWRKFIIGGSLWENISCLTSSLLPLLPMWSWAVISQLLVPFTYCQTSPVIMDIYLSGSLAKIDSFFYRLVLSMHFYHTNRKATNTKLLFKMVQTSFCFYVSGQWKLAFLLGCFRWNIFSVLNNLNVFIWKS